MLRLLAAQRWNEYIVHPMDQLTLVITVLLVLTGFLAFFLWQKISKVEEELRAVNESKQGKQQDLEEARK